MRVIVVGAGVMGSASALELARARDGAEVELLERAVPGAEASSAAAGMLGAQLESHDRTQFALFVRARAGYATWAEELRRDTGIDVGHRVSGALRLAFSEDDARELHEIVRWQSEAGARAEFLEATEARALEPAIGDATIAAAYFPDESQVDPPLLLRALNVAVARHPNITLRSGATVDRVLLEGGAVVGVRLTPQSQPQHQQPQPRDGLAVPANGELRADAVVLAAGSWSSLVGGIESVVPAVHPSRGQLVQLEERPPRVRHILAGGGAYVVPRGDGRVVCGSTVEFVGFRREVTAGGVHRVLEGALALAPSLSTAEIGSMWSSFRPYSTTERPLVGATEVPGLFLATGHHRNGILLAKVTAEAVHAAIRKSAPRSA